MQVRRIGDQMNVLVTDQFGGLLVARHRRGEQSQRTQSLQDRPGHEARQPISSEAVDLCALNRRALELRGQLAHERIHVLAAVPNTKTSLPITEVGIASARPIGPFRPVRPPKRVDAPLQLLAARARTRRPDS